VRGPESSQPPLASEETTRAGSCNGGASDAGRQRGEDRRTAAAAVAGNLFFGTPIVSFYFATESETRVRPRWTHGASQTLAASGGAALPMPDLVRRRPVCPRLVRPI